MMSIAFVICFGLSYTNQLLFVKTPLYGLQPMSMRTNMGALFLNVATQSSYGRVSSAWLARLVHNWLPPTNYFQSNFSILSKAIWKRNLFKIMLLFVKYIFHFNFMPKLNLQKKKWENCVKALQTIWTNIIVSYMDCFLWFCKDYIYANVYMSEAHVNFSINHWYCYIKRNIEINIAQKLNSNTNHMLYLRKMLRKDLYVWSYVNWIVYTN